MTKYALYLESGPRQRKTMVHVLDLMGCIAQGPTSLEAIDAAPAAIRTYLQFLQRHGEKASLQENVTIEVAEHIMQGVWLGYGDPTPGFSRDFESLTRDDLNIYLQRLAWMQDDLLELVRSVKSDTLSAEPPGGGRAIGHILMHVAESEAVYLRYLVGKVNLLSDALRIVQENPSQPIPAMTFLWEVIRTRLEQLTDIELSQNVPHGQVTWTARRALRRILEHTWEHLQEINNRLSANFG